MIHRFRAKYQSFLAWLLSVVLLTSVLAVLPAVQPASAFSSATVNAIADQLQTVYFWLGQDPTDQAAVAEAESRLSSQSLTSVEGVLFPSVLPIDQTAASELSSANANMTPEDDVSQLLLDIATISFSTNENTAVNYFMGSGHFPADENTVEALLPGVSLAQLYQFLLDAQNSGLTSQSSAIQAILSSGANPDITQLTSDLQQWLAGALKSAGTNPANPSDEAVYNDLLTIGWNSADLANAELAIDQLGGPSNPVDPDYQGEIALLKAYVRSQAVYIANGTSYANEGNISLTVGSTPLSGYVSVANTTLSGLQYLSSVPSKVSVSSTGTITPVAVTTTPVAVTVYYSNPATDWIYQVNVSVSGVSIGGGGGVSSGGGSSTPSLTITSGAPPNGTVGQAYSFTFTASNGVAPYTFSVSAGALPDGLTLSSAGDLSGTPSEAGTFTFTVQAKDANGVTSSSQYTVAIGAAPVTPTPLPAQPPFSDITGNWAYSYIVKLAAAGIVNGYPDGTFEPNNNVTRAEFITMLVRADNLNPLTDYSDLNSFADAASIPGWAKPYLAAAVKAGLVKGVEQSPGVTLMDSDHFITRVEMGVIIGRTYQNVNPASLSFADDSSIPAWATTDLGVAVAKGIITGYPDGTFGPFNLATRAETAAMIARFMGLGS